MSANVLSAKDANASLASTDLIDESVKPDVKSMEYHRQVLQNKIAEEDENTKSYVSPSDNIMSPCTAKLSAFRGKQAIKAKPKSLFAQASAKRLEGEGGLFGSSKKIDGL